MKWMAILASFLAGCLVVSLAGCGIDTTNAANKATAEKPRISGILVDIIAFPEDGSNIALFLQFADGTIAKCRTGCFDYIVLRKNVMNKVYISSDNRITLVEIDDGIKLNQAEKPQN
jgi:hypothetical protein